MAADSNKTFLQNLLDGNIPDVPFTVTIDDHSIIRISIAAVIVVTICLLLSQLIHKHTK